MATTKLTTAEVKAIYAEEGRDVRDEFAAEMARMANDCPDPADWIYRELAIDAADGRAAAREESYR